MSYFKKITASAALALCCAVLVACTTTNTNPNVYTTDSAMRQQQVYYATVLSVSKVTITEKNNSNVVGTLMGGGLGYVLGDAIGKGHGNSIARAGGAVVGALAGAKTQEKLGNRTANQIIVHIDGQQQPTVIVQDASVNFTPNERVVVIGHSDRMRVQKIN